MTMAYTQLQETSVYGLGPMVLQDGVEHDGILGTPSPRSSSVLQWRMRIEGWEWIQCRIALEGITNTSTNIGEFRSNMNRSRCRIRSPLIMILARCGRISCFYRSAGWINAMHTLRMSASRPKEMYTSIFLDKLCPLMHLF